MPLWANAFVQIDAGYVASSHECGAAVVSSAPLRSPLLITWDLRTVDAGVRLRGVPSGVVYLEQFGAELRPSAGAGMFVTEWRPEDAQP